jgi:Phosphoheptose isomerase
MKERALQLLEFPCRNSPALVCLRLQLQRALELLTACAHCGGRIMTCGNGGSAADAEHIVGELLKGFLRRRSLPEADAARLRDMFGKDGLYMAHHLQQGVRALSLAGGLAFPTAFANDVEANLVFAQQVWTLAAPGGVVWGISTSGNSANVNFALRAARALGAKTLGFTGRDGGTMAALCDVEIRAPAQETPRIQELHLPLYHALCAALEEELFG